MGGVRLTAQTNPWEDLCRRLAALPNLRSLHIRLDSEDLRPWHKRVNERVFLAQLFRADAREYVLYLPELPEEPERQGLPGSYLQGEILKEAPFEVYRGPRPNNWQLHLSRVRYFMQPLLPLYTSLRDFHPIPRLTSVLIDITYSSGQLESYSVESGARKNMDGMTLILSSPRCPVTKIQGRPCAVV